MRVSGNFLLQRSTFLCYYIVNFLLIVCKEYYLLTGMITLLIRRITVSKAFIKFNY